MILVIDHYDSFTYNLVQYVLQLTSDVRVINYNEINLEDIQVEKVDKVILSPGPKSPTDYQETMKIIDKFKGKVPILGVCLGHQIIAEYFGGKVTYAPYVCHGKAAQVDHDKQGVFTSLTGTLQVGRYHSLIVDRTHFPISELDITSQTTDNLIMGIRHKIYDIEGIQFHPESILTNQGFEIVKNFVLK